MSDYEIKDEEVLKKIKHLYLRQDTTQWREGIGSYLYILYKNSIQYCMSAQFACWLEGGGAMRPKALRAELILS